MPRLTRLLPAATLVVAGLTCFALSGCAEALPGLVGASRALSANPATKVMIFGGPSYATYLGCLNCPESSPDSVHNEYGHHGSAYRQDSIANNYSKFGSQYSQYSACNPSASHPPKIVDSDGHFYGYLTVNAYNPKAFNLGSAAGWLRAICSD